MNAIPRCAIVALISALAPISDYANGGGSAAITARQGASASFHSPMILETVFPTDQSLWKNDEWISGEPYAALEQFSCDGVHIKNLKIRPRLNPDGQTVVAEFRATILNVNSRESHDKRVTIRFDLLNGEKFISGVTTKPKNASDTDTGGYGIGASLSVSASELRADPVTTLQITVTTEDY